MKKLGLLFAAMLLGSVAFGQQIIMDKTDPASGVRTLGTSGEYVRAGFSDKHPLQLSLMAELSDEGCQMSLCISVAEYVSSAVPEGALLLIRTLSGDTIELKNDAPAIVSQDVIGEIVPGTSLVLYHNTGTYPVSDDDLKKIMGGVEKIRMQLGTCTIDSIYKKERWSYVLPGMYRLLKDKINNSGCIREGF